jgi:hypothetical protein
MRGWKDGIIIVEIVIIVQRDPRKIVNNRKKLEIN